MRESLSGFKEEGGWITTVEHGERITAALEEEGIDDPNLDEWNEWRPKAEERFREEINEKTAEQASTEEGNSEKAGKTSVDDLGTAGENLGDSILDLTEGDIEDATEEGRDAVEHAARAVDSTARKSLRLVEETVYKHVMTKVSPCYFDNPLISANLDRIQSGRPKYRFEVNVNDDDLKQRVSDRLAMYDNDIDWWRIEAKKDTEQITVAEGTEPVIEE